MNEKGLQVLEQYDIRLQRSFGGRGSLMLETDQGLKLLKEFAGSQTKLPCEQALLERLEERRVCGVDRIVPNRSGNLVSIGDYDTPYILKNWPPGRECDPRNEEELQRSMRTLARIHREARGVWRLGEEEKRKCAGTERLRELEKHNRELKRAQSFIRNRHKKGSFELLFLQCAEAVFRDGRLALEKLEASGCGELYERALREEHVCHGEYIHHNILISRQETAVVNFQHFEINVQVNDICLCLRKIMEKQNWNGRLAARMLEAYERELALSEQERFYLAVSLYYPEKVWKLIHHYYNSNKAWVPEKSTEKLRVFLEQDERRKRMIRELFSVGF